MFACTYTKEPDGSVYATVGAASIEKCERTFKSNEVEERYGCTKYGSDGFSTTFGTMWAALLTWAVWPF